MEKLTWKEIVALPLGTVVHLELIGNGIAFAIVRSRASLCGYIGLPLSHPLAGRDYDKLPESYKVPDPHGGWTYSSRAGSSWMPYDNLCADLWWLGWDYAHAGDYPFFYDDPVTAGIYKRTRYITMGKKWLIEDVHQDSLEIINYFRTHVRFPFRKKPKLGLTEKKK